MSERISESNGPATQTCQTPQTSEPPHHVIELAQRRAQARAGRDFGGADALRDEIAGHGWDVRDTEGGFELTPRPPFDVWPTVRSLPVFAVTDLGTAGDAGPSPHGTVTGVRPSGTEAVTGTGTDAGDGGTSGRGVASERTGGRGSERPRISDPATSQRGSDDDPRTGTAKQTQAPEHAGDATGSAMPQPLAENAREATDATDDAARHEVKQDIAPGGTIETGLTPSGTASMVASQLLWDGSSATSRIDQSIARANPEARVAADPTTEADRGPTTAAPDTAVETGTAGAGTTTAVTVGLLVDGWPDDVRRCVEALIEHTDAKILALDLGDVDGAGVALHELAERHPDRIQEWHVAERPHWAGGSAGWGESRTKLLRLDDGDVHVVMETSTILDGDAITPLVQAIDGGAVAAGWRGAEPAPGGRDWEDAGPGKVTALLGYLFAVKRSAALDVGGFPEKARFYRNADLEFSLALPGTLVVPDKELPVHQERHRGYHDVDADYREAESRRTYARVLDRLRSTGSAGSGESDGSARSGESPGSAGSAGSA
ncbi:hypothetical protein N5079_17070 [Planotetraspora sp. A-T 1434]|uniref:hypothetical protein n=1 Tax=Planotetraspora sp. A-T 1434 TaxID=2979219 RepID=UPI0021C04FF9|nr:hypothetical protein [Planotetraspora sp. A-T 1434]MCT9931919.1 hypothetical protein [Planotetraspora sp. A-T 1434]